MEFFDWLMNYGLLKKGRAVWSELLSEAVNELRTELRHVMNSVLRGYERTIVTGDR